MTLTLKYDEAVLQGKIQDDPLQRAVLASLQRVTSELEKPRHFWFQRRKKEAVTGLYLYGPVGVGKTFLMDLFYQNVVERHKSRVHFHQFMQQIDGQLRQLQGHADPLKCIAEKLAKKTRLLCIDEFLVLDVATAMVLASLIKYLFMNGIVLVITSNTCPDELYLNGLQRIRFLPAIALIKAHCEVFDLTEHHDYRLGRKAAAKAYLYPLNKQTQVMMLEQYHALAGEDVDETPLSVQGRLIPYIKRSQRVVWFQFDIICNLPRSQLDYLEIATRFDTVLVSDIPILTADDTVQALLLIHFIDVMYDRKVRLIISAATKIDRLYLEGDAFKAFNRTRSRLQEMQSVGYLK
jgi:cell division protein ZapE